MPFCYEHTLRSDVYSLNRQWEAPNVHISGQSNLTYGCIAAARGRFNRIRQVAPMCTPSSTPQSASTPCQFCPLLSRFVCIDRRAFPGRPLFCLKNCPFTYGERRNPSNPWFLGPTSVNIPNESRSVQPWSLTIVTDPTDRPRYVTTPPVTTGRISTAMTPNNTGWLFMEFFVLKWLVRPRVKASRS